MIYIISGLITGSTISTIIYYSSYQIIAQAFVLISYHLSEPHRSRNVCVEYRRFVIRFVTEKENRPETLSSGMITEKHLDPGDDSVTRPCVSSIYTIAPQIAPPLFA